MTGSWPITRICCVISPQPQCRHMSCTPVPMPFSYAYQGPNARPPLPVKHDASRKRTGSHSSSARTTKSIYAFAKCHLREDLPYSCACRFFLSCRREPTSVSKHPVFNWFGGIREGRATTGSREPELLETSQSLDHEIVAYCVPEPLDSGP